VVVNGQLVAASPADELLEQLDDPRVAGALKELLKHADLLAVLVVGLNGLVTRGDTIADSLAGAVGELRGVTDGSKPWEGIDLAGLATSLATLSGSVIGATPALNSLLSSQLTDPQAVEVISQLAQALVEGKAEAAKAPAGPTGVFGLLRILKDEDVSRGLGYLVGVAKSFGRQLG
jgi:hypothetical protein